MVLDSLDGSYCQILLFLPVYLTSLTSNYFRPFTWYNVIILNEFLQSNQRFITFKGQRIIVLIRFNFEKIIFREFKVNKVVVRPEGKDKPEASWVLKVEDSDVHQVTENWNICCLEQQTVLLQTDRPDGTN